MDGGPFRVDPIVPLLSMQPASHGIGQSVPANLTLGAVWVAAVSCGRLGLLHTGFLVLLPQPLYFACWPPGLCGPARDQHRSLHPWQQHHNTGSLATTPQYGASFHCIEEVSPDSWVARSESRRRFGRRVVASVRRWVLGSSRAAVHSCRDQCHPPRPYTGSTGQESF